MRARRLRSPHDGQDGPRGGADPRRHAAGAHDGGQPGRARERAASPRTALPAPAAVKRARPSPAPRPAAGRGRPALARLPVCVAMHARAPLRAEDGTARRVPGDRARAVPCRCAREIAGLLALPPSSSATIRITRGKPDPQLYLVALSFPATLAIVRGGERPRSGYVRRNADRLAWEAGRWSSRTRRMVTAAREPACTSSPCHILPCEPIVGQSGARRAACPDGSWRRKREAAPPRVAPDPVAGGVSPTVGLPVDARVRRASAGEGGRRHAPSHNAAYTHQHTHTHRASGWSAKRRHARSVSRQPGGARRERRGGRRN